MFLIFDTETTGLPNLYESPENSSIRIVQIAMILLDADSEEIASFTSLIRLADDVEIHAGAEAAHGISKEKCVKYGIDIQAALTIFDEFAKNADFVVAHNLKFDAHMLATEMVLSGRGMYNIANGRSGICTMLASTDVCNLYKKNKPTQRKWPKLQEAAKILLNLEMGENAHDALYDCRVTSQILRYLMLNNIVRLPEKTPIA